VLVLALPAQAQMYKCVDARGVTQYSDKPRPECKGEEVDIRGQEPISGKIETSGSDLKAAEREFRQRQLQREREQQEQAKADEARSRRCGQLKAAYQRFTSMRRVPNPGPRGERDYLEASERDAKTAQMEAEIARTCR
jgi:hypothetical protein